MMVEANEKLSGSTSVACWLLRLVKGSELNCTSGTVAGGSEANGSPEEELEFELEPQPLMTRTIAPSPRAKAGRQNVMHYRPASHIGDKALVKIHRTSPPSQWFSM